MKKFSLAVEKKKQELEESQVITERNMYLEFSKKYHKKHGVSGPFDKKFKGDRAGLKRVPIKIHDPPSRKNAVFLGASFMANISEDH